MINQVISLVLTGWVVSLWVLWFGLSISLCFWGNQLRMLEHDACVREGELGIGG